MRKTIVVQFSVITLHCLFKISLCFDPITLICLWLKCCKNSDACESITLQTIGRSLYILQDEEQNLLTTVGISCDNELTNYGKYGALRIICGNKTRLLEKKIGEFLVVKMEHTRSSKISFWCKWIVMKISYLVLSVGDNSHVVWSISCSKIRWKCLFVMAIDLPSKRASSSAQTESRVHMNCNPRIPTWDGLLLRNDNSWDSFSLIAVCAVRIRSCSDIWIDVRRAWSQDSTGPSQSVGVDNWKQ